MHRSARNRFWVIFVWLIVGFFIFPLTPPISQQLPYEDTVLNQPANSFTAMHLETVPSKQAVNLHKPTWPRNEQETEKWFGLSLLILFIIFLHSKVPELLRRFLLAPLKFTSVFVVMLSFDLSQSKFMNEN
ncbi:hypothetical protein [Paenibacillus piri]|uniref:Uncharacterized protein n=1 Tax=Paenibacillus piri TaxID=2547395 RepID=A0A4R5KZR2_9BACL|nr:hypothetical protein [Paenibacillus piri]TDG00809.1 hypothetical protein E1757_04105 [Paenibacillus piri]